MKIYKYELGQLGTNSYLIHDETSSSAVLIDCPFEAAQIIPQELNRLGLKLSAILLTHGHWDHIWDVAELSQKTGAKIYAADGGRKLIEDPSFQAEHLLGSLDIKGAKVDVMPKDNDTFTLAGLKIKCISADGHCPGSIVYYIQDQSVAFVGDVIFQESVGRADLWGGDFQKLTKNIKEKLYTLPDNTVLYPGHGEATSVGYEKSNNPFVRA